MEDTDDDSEPPVPFEASTAAGLHSGNALFDHTTAVFAGGPDSGHVEAATNQLLADDGPSSPPPQEKPDPFRGFTSSSFIDFMRAYSSTGRHPHSGGGPAGGGRPPSKLVQGQVYYIPSETPGGEPVPAVIMPLSRLRELHAALPSAKKPVYDLPPSSSASEGGAEAPFKSSIFSESPFKSSVFSDSPFKSSFADGPFKSPSFSDAPFKTSESPFSSPDAPFKGPSFGGGPPPSKYRPSAPFGKGPKDGFFKAGGGPSSVFPRPHHAGGFPPKPHSLRFGGGGGGGGTGGSSVKITKSVPVYEEHSKLNPQGQQSAAAAATANEPSPALQWPPKETVDVQTYLMPIEQFDSLQSSGPPGPQSPSHHGPPRGPPRGPPPPHHREVRRPVGPHPHRPVRAHQDPGHHHQQHQQHQQHGQLEPGAFAVSSSYRVRPSNG
ncbi:hypothetical protein ONE63_001733 [Megalurothrips usitatus]|uniref:Uncharacterized protein n=1 Tax=Megalurothrips usitatus TaxID=439358 RepID=A0AAV7XFJ2_9NEOP|nr:hypothetical protein ONE63_001733 [Megalurothrips usitatus]